MDYSPFARPLYVMLKPIGAHCNLACEYCYYLEKANLYDGVPRHIISDELLEKFIREYIGAQTMQSVLFTWHGGETLMRPIAFYEKAMRLQQKYAEGRQIDNCIQTNGTLLTDEWCEFFAKNNWLVGVSIDGPQEFHDEYRRTRQGLPSWHKVMKGIELLNKHEVEWNALAVVNDFNADYPLDVYHFFKEINCRYIQFTPIVERIVEGDAEAIKTKKRSAKYKSLPHLANLTDDGAPLAEFSVTPEQWGNFLCTIFDEWVRNDVAEYYVLTFDCTLANWMGKQPSICTFGASCGHAAVMEFNGDVYACDHFVFPEFKLGNTREQSLVSMMYGEQQTEFGKLKTQLPKQCLACKWKFACNGECPKNRFVKTEGEYNLNYLCAGYKKYFAHVAPYMEYMAEQLRQELPPANIMEYLKTHKL